MYEVIHTATMVLCNADSVGFICHRNIKSLKSRNELFMSTNIKRCSCTNCTEYILLNIRRLLVPNKLLIHHLILCFCETRTINDKNQSRRNLCCKGQLYFQCLLFIIKGENFHSDGLNWVGSSLPFYTWQ